MGHLQHPQHKAIVFPLVHIQRLEYYAMTTRAHKESRFVLIFYFVRIRSASFVNSISAVLFVLFLNINITKSQDYNTNNMIVWNLPSEDTRYRLFVQIVRLLYHLGKYEQVAVKEAPYY